MVRRVQAPWRQLNGGVIVAPPGREDFDLLSGPAAAAWLLLDVGMSVDTLRRELSSSLEMQAVPEPEAVEALLVDLASRGLVEDVTS